MNESSMARALHWLRQQNPPTEHLSALEEAVAGYVEPKVETVRQPAGDGVRIEVAQFTHPADSLCHPETCCHPDYSLLVNGQPFTGGSREHCIAIGQNLRGLLTAAGRGGEGAKVPTGPYVERIIRIFRDKPHDDTSALVLIDYANARLAATPQQPPPVGVTDAVGQLDKTIADMAADELAVDYYATFDRWLAELRFVRKHFSHHWGWACLLSGLAMDIGAALAGSPGAWGLPFYLFAFLFYAKLRDEELANLHRKTLSRDTLRRIAGDYEEWGDDGMAKYVRGVAEAVQ